MDSIIYTQKHYGALVPVTKDMRKFDLHDQIYSICRSISDDAFDKIDQSMADVLLNGWSTSYADVFGSSVSSVGPDGLALFSASHTNGSTSSTYSNVVNDGTNSNPALSRAAIVKERATALKYTDPNGIHRPIRLDTIVVSPDQEDLVNRILYSDQIQGSGNNDINPTGLRSMKVVTWERLGSDSAGNDKSDYWFMMDSSKSKETLKAKFAERPSLDAPEETYRNKNWDYTLDFYYTLGLGFAPYIRGSKGDNS